MVRRQPWSKRQLNHSPSWLAFLPHPLHRQGLPNGPDVTREDMLWQTAGPSRNPDIQSET